MVEQVLGLDKKPEISRSLGKRLGTTNSNPQPKRSNKFQSSGRFGFKLDRNDRNRGRQKTVSTSSIRGPSWNIEIPECQYCGNKHQRERWKLTGGCFRCGSTDHFVKVCPKINKAEPTISQRSKSTSRGQGSGKGG